MQFISSETCRSVRIIDDVLINSYQAMDPSFQGFEFLDLANVNDAELDHINNVLYAPDRGVKYPELPWVEPNYDAGAAAGAAAGPAGYPVPVSHAVPMYLPSVYVNNVTANVSVHHPYLGYHHTVYEQPPPPPPQGRGRGRGKVLKGPREVSAPHGYQPAPAQYVHSHPYNTYYQGHAAAHAAGPPLFLPSHAVPMYPGAMGYAAYHPQPMYAPAAAAAEPGNQPGAGNGGYAKFDATAAAHHEYQPQHEYREVKDPAVSYTEKGTTHYRLPEVAVPTTNGFSASHDIGQSDEHVDKGSGPTIVSELKGDAQVFMPARRNTVKLSFTAAADGKDAFAPDDPEPAFPPAFVPFAPRPAASAIPAAQPPANRGRAPSLPAKEVAAVVVPAVEVSPTVVPANESKAFVAPAIESKAFVAPANEGGAVVSPANGVVATAGGEVKAGPVPANEKPGLAVKAAAAPEVLAVKAEVQRQSEPKVVEPPAPSEAPPTSPPAAEPAPSAWGGGGGGRSWASLFRPSAGPQEAEPKQVARVEPFRASAAASAADAARQRRRADDPQLYRLGEVLCRHELDHRAVSLQPRGLSNRGNWCYVNSTLQALLACPPFYNLMKSLPPPPQRPAHKSPTPIVDSIVQFVNEFAALSSVSRTNRKERTSRKEDSGSLDVPPGPAFEPAYIYKMLNNIRSDTFKVEGRQEDAEEFLSCLLNALNDEMLEAMKLVQDTDTPAQRGHHADVDADADASADEADQWTVMGPKNKGALTRRAEFARTPVADIFRGNLRSRVQRAGDQSTDNVQPFFTLQLDIEKAGSVREALELLAGRDQLEGVTCTKTNQEVEAWQQVTLDDLPLVLLLHLKWFDYRVDGCTKIVKSVEFPVELKLDPKLMSSTKKYAPKAKAYKLFAVVYHDGKEATKGHYVTDAFHVGCGGWVRYDDSAVRAVTESQVLHPKSPRVPYLLYYRRGDTIGPQAASTPAAAAAAATK